MKSINKKNIIAGLGEIGLPIHNLLSKKSVTLGFDTNEKLMDKKIFDKYENTPTLFLHICIPFSKNFIKHTKELVKKFDPEILVIHSTISPNTTSFLQSKLDIPVIYSATRGVHKRMGYDLKRYTKFFAISDNAPKKQFAIKKFKDIMKLNGVKTKLMSKPETLELGKIICDTSYLGWLINYAQLSNMIAINHQVDYDEMWSFSDEIHKFLGNRPKLFPGFIGGHCVIPNLELINEKSLNQIDQINKIFEKFLNENKL